MSGSSVRHARLRRKFAWLYPEISPGLWLAAGGIALRLAARIWREEGVVAVVSRRLLSGDHFEFRGGRARDLVWGTPSERLDDGYAAPTAPDY